MRDDVIIIGGGAAGLCAAVTLKKAAPDLKVRLLESLPRVGKKLAATGNGRCNITNKNITAERYHGLHPEFCLYALQKYDNKCCEDFFNSIGVPFVYEGDKAYPASLQAASVVDCLRFAAEEYGATICTETKVTNIQVSGGAYKVIAGNMSFLADNIVIAAGLLSGGEKLGNDGSMLALLKKAGFKTVETHPAIVQLKTKPDNVRQLKGIKVNASAALKQGKRVLKSEYGEVLFCDYGLSGPPILQLSGAAGGEKNITVSLDLVSDKDFNTLFEVLLNRAKRLKNRTLDEFFTGMLNKRLGQVIIKSAGLRLNDKAESLKKADILKITALLKDMSFEVTGNTGYINSQVTGGGLDTSGFDCNTMMSREYKGLYAIGEILDIDGDCGGFNLKWAWSSAMCAAFDIVKRSNNAFNK
ncbi:MAG TPA: aminoacetone oxidase family FAD-binding enzyme [Ruminococcaceae bacterium]|nr:aminoacetone oxidase family FAD-binding enzyme [Oscillospiraceae bacterium]